MKIKVFLSHFFHQIIREWGENEKKYTIVVGDGLNNLPTFICKLLHNYSLVHNRPRPRPRPIWVSDQRVRRIHQTATRGGLSLPASSLVMLLLLLW